MAEHKSHPHKEHEESSREKHGHNVGHEGHEHEVHDHVLQDGSQQSMVELRMLEEKLQALAKHKEMVNGRIMEIDSTRAGLEEISKAKEDVIFHVGGEAFVKAKPLPDNKVVVMLGADVAVERSMDEAKAILESRRAEAMDALAEVDKEILTLT